MTTRLLAPSLLLAAAAVAPAMDDLQFHGYVSQGFLLTKNNALFTELSEDKGTFEQTEAGLNVSATPVDRLRIGMQITASDNGEYGNMLPGFDYAYGQYQIPTGSDTYSWSVTAGRFKNEYGFYNEYRDLDMTRTSVFLPFVVYDPRFRDAFIATNGVQTNASADMGDLGSADINLRLGNVGWDEDNGTLAKNLELGGLNNPSISTEFVWGGTLTWNTPIDGVRTRFSFLEAEELLLSGSASNAIFGTVLIQNRIPSYSSGVLGIEAQRGNFTVVTEGAMTYYKSENTTTIPSVAVIESTSYLKQYGWYVSGAWRFDPKFEAMLGYQWGMSDPVTSDSKDDHRSIMGAIRWDVTEHWLIKLEGQVVNGTLVVDGNEQADGTEESHWGLVAIKTTFDF